MSNDAIKKLYTIAYQKAKKDIEDKTMPYTDVLHIINNISNAYETHKMLSDKLSEVKQQVDDGIKALPQKVYGMLLWGNIIDKPVQFPPTPHIHTWDSIAGKPNVFNPMQHNIIDYHTVPANSNQDVPITNNGTLQLRRLRIDDIKDLDNRLTNIQETAGKGYVTIRGGGSSGTPLTVKEEDGIPSVNNVSTIVVSNGTLTDDGSGQVTLTTGGGTSIDSGDTFPVAPTVGDYFFRTDLGLLARYNGAEWDYYELPSTVMLTTTYDTAGDGVIDTSALPSVSSTSAGIVPSTSGTSLGDVLAVKADGTLEYITPLTIDSGTSFPLSPSTGDYFFRTDLGVLARYIGEGWNYLDTADFVLDDDSRLSDARPPTSHASTHQHGGSDEIATATPTPNAIPKAGSGGTLSENWIPTLQLSKLDTSAASEGDVITMTGGVPAWETPSGGSTLATPTGLVVVGRTRTSITLEWDEYPSFIEIADSPDDTTYTHAAYVSGVTPTYTHTGLSPGESFYYKVRSVVGETTSAYTSSVSGSTPYYPTVGTPLLFPATAGTYSSVNFDLSGITTDTLMVAAVFSYNTTVSATPAGWTSLTSITSGTYNKLYLYSRIAESGDSSVSFALTASAYATGILVPIVDVNSTHGAASAQHTASPGTVASISGGLEYDIRLIFSGYRASVANQAPNTTTSGVDRLAYVYNSGAPNALALFTEDITSNGTTQTASIAYANFSATYNASYAQVIVRFS